MTVVEDRTDLAAIGASHEQIVFSKLNVRAPRRLRDAQQRFESLIVALDSIHEGEAVEYRFHDGQNQEDSWFFTRYGPGLLSIESVDVRKYVVFTLRRESNTDDGQIVVIDREKRWIASALPSGLSPKDAAADASLFLKTMASMGETAQSDDISYDVDLVCTPEAIIEWLREHKFITDVVIWTWRSNPGGIDFDPTIAALDELEASRVRQHFINYPGHSLRVTEDAARSIGYRLANGNGRLKLTAQDADGFAESFDTYETPAQVVIAGASTNLRGVLERTVDELQFYVARIERELAA